MTETPLAVVTGAGSGVGRACVARLLRDGFRVAALGRRMATLRDTETLLNPDDNGRLFCIEADVRDSAGLKAAVSGLGPVVALVANAGVCQRTRLDDPSSDATWHDIIDINLNGVWHTFRAVSETLAENSAVVVVSSGLGKLGRPGYTAYAATKHAVLGMVKCLAPELADRGIRVNAVCPGWVDTEMADRDLTVTATEQAITKRAAREAAEAGIPLGRFVTADEVADLIAFLVSPQSGAITGQSYNISCGEFTV